MNSLSTIEVITFEFYANYDTDMLIFPPLFVSCNYFII